jgi:hypothetical protein
VNSFYKNINKSLIHWKSCDEKRGTVLETDEKQGGAMFPLSTSLRHCGGQLWYLRGEEKRTWHVI